MEGEIAVSCFGTLQATHDPYLYSINLTVHPAHTPDEVLQAVDDELKRVMDSPVTQEEIARAIKQAKALFAYSSENISNQPSGWATPICSPITIGSKLRQPPRQSHAQGRPAHCPGSPQSG